MKRNLNCLRPLLWSTIATSIALASILPARAESDVPHVGATPSTMVKGVTVYSIRFLGGTAADFFSFLRTNGFAGDTVLFAGRAGDVHIPDFTVNNVRLKDVAKAIELVTEDRLSVDVLERGLDSDVNFWRIRISEHAAPIKSRACATPNLFRKGDGDTRISLIVETAERTLYDGLFRMDRGGDNIPRGRIQPIDAEKIVVVVGAEAYVEAVASALEAAEKVAASESLESLQKK